MNASAGRLLLTPSERVYDTVQKPAKLKRTAQLQQTQDVRVRRVRVRPVRVRRVWVRPVWDQGLLAGRSLDWRASLTP